MAQIPKEKTRTIIQKYWDCGVYGCDTYHLTKKTALACIKRDKTKQKNNKLLNKQREKYINSINGIPLDEIKLSEFLCKASVRTRHCLRVLGDITVADFLKIPEKNVLKKRNFGKKGLSEIKYLINRIVKKELKNG